MATIGERPSGLYRGVATSQGFYMIALCACAYEFLAGLRLYLACFTPVAPVASLWSNIRPTSCPSRSCCVSLVQKVRENGYIAVSFNLFAYWLFTRMRAEGAELAVKRGQFVLVSIIWGRKSRPLYGVEGWPRSRGFLCTILRAMQSGPG